MRSAQQWVGEYSESHRNATNKLIHKICVPAIVWTVAALLWCIPVPAGWPVGTWSLLSAALALVFYFRLSLNMGLGMLCYFAVAFGLCYWLARWIGLKGLGGSAAVVFVVAWIAQFIGPDIEGKRPSFMKDLAFLLVGPMWLLADLYRRSGIKY